MRAVTVCEIIGDVDGVHLPVTLDVVHAGLEEAEEHGGAAEAELADGGEEDGQRQRL